LHSDFLLIIGRRQIDSHIQKFGLDSTGVSASETQVCPKHTSKTIRMFLCKQSKHRKKNNANNIAALLMACSLVSKALTCAIFVGFAGSPRDFFGF